MSCGGIVPRGTIHRVADYDRRSLVNVRRGRLTDKAASLVPDRTAFAAACVKECPEAVAQFVEPIGSVPTSVPCGTSSSTFEIVVHCRIFEAPIRSVTRWVRTQVDPRGTLLGALSLCCRCELLRRRIVPRGTFAYEFWLGLSCAGAVCQRLAQVG